MKKLFFVLLFSFLPVQSVLADVVKPALVEITVDKNRQVTVEVRASVEALLTGINARYKNTKESPNAKQYDEFREMSADELLQAFAAFKNKFLDTIELKVDSTVLSLTIESIHIPPTGYTKVPRISVIVLNTMLPTSAKPINQSINQSIRWYYPAEFGDNAVRVKQVDSETQQWHWSQWQWLRNNEASAEFSLTEIVSRQSTFVVIVSYVVIGFEHIVPKGLDHILFVLGLFLLSTQLSPLLWQVTMFTVAHTITLGLAMNNIIALPANVVEPLIALSIFYVGIENIFARGLRKSRLLLVFVFGLLHGLGFASVLTDFGMPADDFTEALIGFNIGVEFGQLAVILLAFIVLRLGFKNAEKYRKIVVLPGSVFISMIGLFWFLERLELF